MMPYDASCRLVLLVAVAALALAGAAACDTNDDTVFPANPTGGGGSGGGGGGASGGAGGSGGAEPAVALRIYVEGDLTAKTFSDGFSGQTPSSYVMGLSRFDIMTSADDPSPVTVFDHGQSYVEVDMLSTTLAGVGDITEIPAALYTHGKVRLTMTRFDVATTVHVVSPPSAIAGTVTVVAALSDTFIDGEPWTQHQVEYTFNILGGITTPGILPPLPSTGGGTVVEDNGETWLVFPMTPALAVDPAETNEHSATIIYEVFESFRWEDEDLPDYQDGVFDASSAGSSEPVRSFGATGYSIVTE